MVGAFRIAAAMINISHEQESLFDLRPHDRIYLGDKSYTVSKIARGGMGFVLLIEKDTTGILADFSVFGSRIALKCALPNTNDSEETNLFRRELTVWAGFDQRNIVALLAILNGDDAGWVAVMNWCLGSLRDILTERSKLQLNEANAVLINIIDGLSYAYNKNRILHLDIKPENILYDIDIFRKTGDMCYSNNSLNRFRFMLSDWGIASIKERELNAIAGLSKDFIATSSTLNNIGTLKYMAPERFQRGVSSSIYSDMFSLGMLYLEALTGQLPFREQIPVVEHLWSGHYMKDACELLETNIVPKQICDVILNMITPRPQDRPSDYTTLRTNLIRAYKKTLPFYSRFI